jgi:hypothetical protein
MLALLECAVGELNDNADDQGVKGAPDHVSVQPGALAVWDDCCDCDEESCGGQVWVRLVRAHPTDPFPTKVLRQLPCPDVIGVQVAVGIIRCVSSLDDQAKAPPPATLILEGHQMVCDMAALLRAAECCLEGDEVAVLDQWVPLGASGGCAGGEWTVWWDNPVTCSPIEPDEEEG